MTLPLWAQLEKSQDDPETIEQAIARLIAVHEEAPTSHLGEGESLSEHKHNTVIDHPAGSVVADKSSYTEMLFETTFENLAGHTISTHVDNDNWPGVTLGYYDGGADIVYIETNCIGLLEETTITKNIKLDFYFYIDDANDVAVIQSGITTENMLTLKLGMRITGNTIVGVARWGGEEHVTGTLYTMGTIEVINVRIYYDVEEGVIHFYVNGEERGTLQPASAVESYYNVTTYIDAQTEESGIMRMYRMSIARGI